MHAHNLRVTYYLPRYPATETVPFSNLSSLANWIVVAWPKNELLIRSSFATQLLQTEHG